MKVRYILIFGIIVALVVMSAIVWFAWPKSKNQSVTVKSDDGRVEMVLPANSFDKSVRPENIRISKDDVSNYGAESEDQTIRGAYKFEPEGLTFNQPVTVKVQLDNQKESMLELFLIDNGSGEAQPLDDQEMSVTVGTGVSTISGSLTHFSSLIVTDSFFGINISDPGTYYVGENLSAKIGVRVVRENVSIKHPMGVTNQFVLQSPWKLTGKVYASLKNRALEPELIENQPAETSFSSQESYNGEVTFKCVKPGEEYLVYHVALKVSEKINTYKTGKATPPKPGQIFVFDYNVTLQSKNGRCLGAEQIESNTLTPETNANQTESADTMEVEVLTLDTLDYPLFQFKNAKPDLCGEDHYHALQEQSAFSYPDYKIKLDPNPTGCGYGKVKEIPKKIISIKKSDFEAFQKKVGF